MNRHLTNDIHGQPDITKKYYVYVIKSQDGYIKVGYTGDLEQRIKSLQTGSPFSLSYHKIIQTEDKKQAQEIEKHLLDEFRIYSKSQEGEWFFADNSTICTVLFHLKRFASLRNYSILAITP